MNNWLKNIFSRSPPTIPISSNDIWNIFPRPMSSAGVAVTRETALSLPALWKGINLISNKIANTSCRIYERGPNNSRIRDENHPAYQLLRGFANPIQSHFEFMRCLVTNAIISGNGYAVIDRDYDATPTSLWILDPEQTQPYVTYDGYKPALYYQSVVNGQTFTFQNEDIIHIKGPTSPCGLVGYRLIDILRENLGLNIATQRYGAHYFKNNGSVTNVITVPKMFTNKEQLETFRAGIEEKHVGLDNAFRFMVLQNEATFEHVTIDNESAQFIESRQMTLTDMANALGLTASKLNGTVATSYSSLEVENLSQLGDLYSPWLTNVQQQFSKLLREDELKTHYVEFDLNDLVTLDETTRVTNAISKLNNGLESWEEIRAGFNLPTVQDDSQQWRLPANIIIQGEEPPVAPQGQQPNDAQNVVEDSPQELPEETQEDDTTSRNLQNLLTATVERLLTRMKKDYGRPIEEHRSVIEKALPGFSTVWLDQLEAELANVLPEQKQSVIKRLNTRQIMEDIMGRDANI